MVGGPEMIVAELAVAGLAIAFVWRALIWVKAPPTSPDPWDKEVEERLHDPEAVAVCHRCFTPINSNGWFCEHCGSAVGPYNNILPYVVIFSQGEVLRNGVSDRFHRKGLIAAGYLLFTLSQYAIFAPFYWIPLFKNLKHRANAAEEPDSPQFGLPPGE